jgi:hypothetical protein
VLGSNVNTADQSEEQPLVTSEVEVVQIVQDKDDVEMEDVDQQLNSTQEEGSKEPRSHEESDEEEDGERDHFAEDIVTAMNKMAVDNEPPSSSSSPSPQPEEGHLKRNKRSRPDEWGSVQHPIDLTRSKIIAGNLVEVIDLTADQVGLYIYLPSQSFSS